GVVRRSGRAAGDAEFVRGRNRGGEHRQRLRGRLHGGDDQSTRGGESRMSEKKKAWLVLENGRAWAEAFVIREMSRIASNFRASESLSDWLSRRGIVAIEGVDTRKLTR